MSNLIVNPKEFGLEEKEAKGLVGGLPTILKEREVLIDAYEDMITQEVTEDTIPLFKSLRLEIRDNRTKGIQVWHKKTKDYFLNGGRFVDSIKNKEVEVNERMEAKLLDAEKHFENIEKERLSKIQSERVSELEPYLEDAHERDLACMEEDVWQSYLKTKKDDYNARIEAEKKLEAERLAKIKAEEEAREQQRLENLRLKQEAEEREKAIELERKKAEKLEAKRQAELKAEREKQAKLQAELEAKRQAELKAENERKQAELKAKAEAEEREKAPLKEKMTIWVNSFDIGEAPEINDVTAEIVAKFEAFKKWSINQIKSL